MNSHPYFRFYHNSLMMGLAIIIIALMVHGIMHVFRGDFKLINTSST